MKLLVVCLAAAGLAAAQIYPPVGLPGGYPPGYPSPYPGGGPVPNTGGGIPSPRRGNKQPAGSKTNQNQPLPNFRGKLKQMDSKTISLELDDYRVMEFRVTGKTKYTKNGDALKSPKFNPGEFNPGDQVSVEATEEPDASMTAVNVYWEKSAAAAGADAKTENKDGVFDTWKDAPKDPNDPGPPKLKRSQPAEQQASPAAEATPASPTPAPREAAPNVPLVTETADSKLPPAPAVPNDPGPPSLKRGKPVERRTNSAADSAPVPSRPAPQQTASAVSLPTVDLPPVALPRSERPQDQVALPARKEDRLIQRATEAALEFTETLPNYVCQEMMNRSESSSQPANWHALDVISMEVVYENGKENYRNFAVNGKPTSKPLSELGGAYSTGEFGTVLIDLFSPATAAEFHPRGESRIAGVTAKSYDFEVQRENSHWDLHFGSQTYSPAYSGSVWIDPETARVLRIEMQARSLPKDFPTDHVESATDYQYVRLGGTQQFLLPVHSETLSCQRGTPYCSRNMIDFRNYHKYTGESTVEFGPVKQ